MSPLSGHDCQSLGSVQSDGDVSAFRPRPPRPSLIPGMGGAAGGACEEAVLAAARELPLAPYPPAGSAQSSTYAAAPREDPTWAALVGGSDMLMGIPQPPDAWLGHSVVVQAHAYLRQSMLDQKFLDMDSELHACVVAEVSTGLGPLRPLRHGHVSSGAATTAGFTRASFGEPAVVTMGQAVGERREDRTGLDAEPGRLRERPLEDLGRLVMDGRLVIDHRDVALLRQLQADADAESAHHISGGAFPDEQLARTLQAEFDAEEAASLGQGLLQGPADFEDDIAAPHLDQDPALRRPAAAAPAAAVRASGGNAAMGSAVALELRTVELRRRQILQAQRAAQAAGLRQPPDHLQALRRLGAEAAALRHAMELSASESVGFAAPRASAEQVAAATSTVPFRATHGAPCEECSICRDDFEDGVELRLLPCLHKFHPACIDRWLAQCRTCPVCKHDITQ
mmetsp:Transcript_12906/g.35024  ORF Transcript_12906/g.35024 Transcript_12906/m.35024 type:complete len:454 (-) Transcript_12906:57-1418(-)